MQNAKLKTRVRLLLIFDFAFLILHSASAAEEKLPSQPWQRADIWWTFENSTPHFETLEVEVTVDRDVPATCNLYVSSCGIAQINDLDFCGGRQSNINGQVPKLKSARAVHPAAGEQAGAPDAASAVADGSNSTVTLGPIFQRAEKDRKPALDLPLPAS